MNEPTTQGPSVHEVALQELIDDLTQATLSGKAIDLAGARELARYTAEVLEVVRIHVARLPDLARLDSKRLGACPFVGLLKGCAMVEQDLVVLRDGLRAAVRG